ncbi:uncharacterized protein C8A04DRAFT_23784 [Dichotomopilus funicola]|uniref:Uncharacterized protein n=1 Tax=Dichotomopilus funicola TaxID=1934379 RepID=A0AAN6VAQ9_9PEZI|nr:hypothetical protein C8A04DRAFT_23784 [Dichotomopilus funicola]
MVLPPTTPAPSRFLSSKRSSTQLSQTQTPNQNVTQRSSQFHATPRFATSTPRPSSTRAGATYATPALAIKSRVPRSRSTQDIIDDSSPVGPEDGSPPASASAWSAFPEPIEFDSSLVEQSPSSEDPRSPKRRRISIASSEPETEGLELSQDFEGGHPESSLNAPGDRIASYSPELENGVNYDQDHHGSVAAPDTHMISSSPVQPSSPIYGSEWDQVPQEREEEEEGVNSEPTISKADSNASPAPATLEPTARFTVSKSVPPAFRAGPRFKPTEPPDKFPIHPNAYLTADIFSPQRRGARYLPGGLAAELRDWLVDVKGSADGKEDVKATWSASGLSAGSTRAVQVTVDAVSSGGVGMTLVTGRVQDDGRVIRIVLAGEGNLEGLEGNRGKVIPGAVVSIAPPAWDVHLDGQWTVAYRWSVVDHGR